MKTNIARRQAGIRNNVTPIRPNATVKAKTGFLRFPDVDAAVANMRPAEPMHCLFPDALTRNAATFLKHFPGTTFYAVKVNPDPYVLTRLYAAGVHSFDVASLGEVKLVRELLPDAFLAFMHPVKGRAAIRSSYFDFGVRTFVLDSFDELRKIVEETKNADDLTLIVRLAMPKGSAYHSMAGKFGAPEELGVALLQEVRKVARKVGITFIVGSQTLDPVSYASALRTTGRVIGKAGFMPDVVDVGGGFPIPGLGMDVPPLTAFFDAIREELKVLNLPQNCQVWCEPGAALAGTSSTVVVRVELRKDDVLYINDGAYGNLSDLCWNKRRNDMRMIRPEQKTTDQVALKPFRIYGATCDTPDYLPGPFMLPEDIKEGDWIAVSSLGAYGQTFRSNYNSFFSNINVEIREPYPANLLRLRPKVSRR